MAGVLLLYGYMNKRHVLLFAWILTIVVAILAVIAWAQSLVVPIDKLTIYDVFTVFGIVAFSIMWAHYMVSAAARYYEIQKPVLARYYSWSALVVLGALLLHPVLLMWQLWRDGVGLPIDYVAPDMRLFLILGQIAFFLFIAYEFHRKYENRNWWHYVERASDLAMILVLIHGYQLGKDLLPDWFMALWLVYGVTFFAAVTYSALYRYRLTQKVL